MGRKVLGEIEFDSMEFGAMVAEVLGRSDVTNDDPIVMFHSHGIQEDDDTVFSMHVSKLEELSKIATKLAGDS